MEPTRSPQQAPLYAMHRQAVAGTDSLPELNEMHGMNMKGYSRAHVQIVPSGGSNPTVQVQWWSAAAGKFVQEQTPITKAGVGANTPYEFTVDCRGRNMFVAVTTQASGQCDIHIAGAEHELVT